MSDIIPGCRERTNFISIRLGRYFLQRKMKTTQHLNWMKTNNFIIKNYLQSLDS